jgi:hypothetical protein
LKDPCFSLGGGCYGPNFMRGRMMVSDAVPQDPLGPDDVSRKSGVRADPMRRGTLDVELFDPVDYQGWQERARANQLRSRAETERKGLKASLRRLEDGSPERAQLESKIAALDQQILGYEEAAGSGTSLQLPLAGYEAIPAGVVMTHQLVVTGTLVEIGLLLATLDSFGLDNPYVGGHRATGAGVVAFDYQIRARVANAIDRFSNQGQLKLIPFTGGTFTNEGPIVAAARAAWADAAANILDGRFQFGIAASFRTGTVSNTDTPEPATAKKPGRRRRDAMPAAAD